MKINSIKISNILSFQQSDDTSKATEIQFNDGLNIIIGPNGAGKSNFLEVINRMFKSGLIMECILNRQPMRDFVTKKLTSGLQHTLTFNEQRKYRLPKNRLSDTDKQFVEVTLGLNVNDKKNLEFLVDNIEKINKYLRTYSNINASYDENISKEELLKINTITFPFQLDLYGKDNWGVEDIKEPIPRFIFMYFRWFQFIQNLIPISNELENESWPPLKNTFAIMSGYRNYGTIQSEIKINDQLQQQEEQIRDAIFSEGARTISSGEPAVFRYVKNRILNDYVDLEIKLSQGIIDNQGKPNIELLNSPILDNINKFLDKFLQLRLKIERKSIQEYSFNFENTESKDTIEIADLSSGEKEIINFIFNLFGYDLENAIMIVDEPELHLHPQLQEKFLNIIQEAIASLDIQFVIATHSPIFVNEKSIDGLLRFYKENGFTKVVKPSEIPLNIRNKIRLLNFSNSSTIFFNNTVVLTESYPDRIFFKAFFEKYKEINNIEDESIVFLDMSSADDFENWDKFLIEFKINSKYIGDCDNVKRKYVSKNASDWNIHFPTKMLYTELTSFKSNHSQDYQNLMNEIKSYYTKNIFLLKGGSMEDYFLLLNGKNPISDPKPKPEKIIPFSINDLDRWISSNSTHPIVVEIFEMFNKIIQK